MADHHIEDQRQEKPEAKKGAKSRFKPLFPGLRASTLFAKKPKIRKKNIYKHKTFNTD